MARRNVTYLSTVGERGRGKVKHSRASVDDLDIEYGGGTKFSSPTHRQTTDSIADDIDNHIVAGSGQTTPKFLKTCNNWIQNMCRVAQPHETPTDTTSVDNNSNKNAEQLTQNNNSQSKTTAAAVSGDTLHQAARTGDTHGLAQLIDQMLMLQQPQNNRRDQLDALDDTGSAPLHYAARYNHVAIARLLLAAGASANVRAEDGQTPLHFACRHKVKLTNKQNNTPAPPVADSILVVVLVRAGANLNARDRYGNTPLHVAVMRCNEQTVRQLLEFPSVSVDIQDESKQTPLHIAALNGQSVEILRMLIGRTSGNLRNVDANRHTPLHLASAQGNLQAVRILLVEAVWHANNNNTETSSLSEAVSSSNLHQMLHDTDDEHQIPLVLAVAGGHMDVAQELIAAGSTVDYPNESMDSSLHISAARGDVDMCQLLVDSGATLEACNSRHQTPLHRAAALNRLAVVEYLTTIGADLEVADQNAWTPVLMAARHGHVDVVRKLIAKGANIYAVSKRDRNALFLAAASNHWRTVQALLDSPWGVELMFRSDRHGLFPLHVACKKGHLEVVRIMIRRGAPIDERLEDEKTPLHLAAQFGWHQIVALITDENTDLINYEDENGDTALHLAALNGHLDTVVKLLRIGANIAPRNSNQWTPLGYAASRGHTPVCTELLRSEAPVDPKDKNGTTPLHFACASGFLATARVLIEAGGASISCCNADGKNCLDFAIDSGHRDVARFIVRLPKWRDAMRNEQSVCCGEDQSVNNENQSSRRRRQQCRDTPMRKLIRLMPDVAYIALNMCITTTQQHTSNNNGSDNLVVSCNFEFIDDTFCEWFVRDTDDAPSAAVDNKASADKPTCSTTRLRKADKPYSLDYDVLKRNHPLSVMVRYKQEDLLTHPLTTCLIQTKWSLFGRFAFFSQFLIYSTFLAFLTGFIFTSHPLNRLYKLHTNATTQTFTTYWADDLCAERTLWPLTYDVNALHDSHEVCKAIETFRNNNSSCTMQFLDDIANRQPASYVVFHRVGRFVLFAMSCVILLKEMLICFFTHTFFGNIMVAAIHIMTIIIAMPWQGVTHCYYQYGLMASWAWQLASFDIFLAWIQLVLFLRNFPWLGLYVQMLEDVTRTVMQFFPVFFLVLTAFSLAFYLAFKGSARHEHVPRFIEQVYDSDFSLDPFYSIPQAYVKTFTMFVGEFEQEAHFQNTNQPVILVLYVIFLLICVIIIINLMIGLAVQDITALREHAALKRVAMRIELILTVERLMPLTLRARMFRYKSVLQTTNAAGVVEMTMPSGRVPLLAAYANRFFSWLIQIMKQLVTETLVSADDVMRAQRKFKTSSSLPGGAKTEPAAGVPTTRTASQKNENEINIKSAVAATTVRKNSDEQARAAARNLLNVIKKLSLPRDSDGHSKAAATNLLATSAVLFAHEQLLQRVDVKLAAFQDEIRRKFQSVASE